MKMLDILGAVTLATAIPTYTINHEGKTFLIEKFFTNFVVNHNIKIACPIIPMYHTAKLTICENGFIYPAKRIVAIVNVRKTLAGIGFEKSSFSLIF